MIRCLSLCLLAVLMSTCGSRQQPATQQKSAAHAPAQPTEIRAVHDLTKLLTAGGAFMFPTTPGTIRKALGHWTSFDVENTPNGPRGLYHWRYAGGLILTARAAGTGDAPVDTASIRSILLTSATEAPMGHLVFGLVFNETTLSDCRKGFGSALSKTDVPDVWLLRRAGTLTELTFDSDGLLLALEQRPGGK